jgi:hypothetical protein
MVVGIVGVITFSTVSPVRAGHLSVEGLLGAHDFTVGSISDAGVWPCENSHRQCRLESSITKPQESEDAVADRRSERLGMWVMSCRLLQRRADALLCLVLNSLGRASATRQEAGVHLRDQRRKNYATLHFLFPPVTKTVAGTLKHYFR